MEKNTTIDPNMIPSVGSSYNLSWDCLKKNFVELLLIIVISFAISIPIAMLRGAGDAIGMPGGIILGLMSVVFGLFVSAPISYGVAFVFLKLIRDEKFDVSDVFAGFKNNYINVILANLLVMAIVMAGILFFIVPGIIFACKLAFVPYLIMDKKMETVDAVKTSWDMTKGHTLTIFLIGLLAIPIFLLGLLLLVVGTIPAIMWIKGASAAIYHTVDTQLNPEEKENKEVITEITKVSDNLISESTETNNEDNNKE